MNINSIRADFPVLEKWVYLDSACYSLKPKPVIEKINEYYLEYPACAERSAHELGERASSEVEKARKLIAKLINAKPEEIIFTKNTTEAINLLASSLNIEKKVITSDKEHNSNLLPWIKWGWKNKAVEHGNISDLEKSIAGFSLVSMPLVSNLDGSTIPLKEVIDVAHSNGALVSIDGAQGVPHMPVDVKKYDIDFLAFSGHKMLGPSGTGALYVKEEYLSKLSHFLVGGGTANNSTFNSYTPVEAPEVFEAGLQNYAGIIGFGKAAEYLMNIGMENIERHDKALLSFLLDEINNRNIKINIIGANTSILSFTIDNMHVHDIALMLNEENIAIRSGMHCGYAWFNKYGLKGTARASLYLYNNKEDIIKFVDALEDISALS